MSLENYLMCLNLLSKFEPLFSRLPDTLSTYLDEHDYFAKVRAGDCGVFQCNNNDDNSNDINDDDNNDNNDDDSNGDNAKPGKDDDNDNDSYSENSSSKNATNLD